MRFNRSTGILCLLFSLTISGVYAAEQPVGKNPGTVTLGRHDKATPWLRLVDEPDQAHIVNYFSIPRAAMIPQQTAFYSIDPDVVISGYFYHFYVHGRYSDYVVTSTIRLAKLCRELEVLDELRQRDLGGEFFIGIGEGVAGVGKGLANLVTKPQKTFRTLGSKIGRTFKGYPKVGKDESGTRRSLLGEGPAGAERRHIAYKMDIDVYTDNPDLRHVLSTIARTRVAGDFAVSFAPGSELSALQTLMRDEETEKLIRDQAPGDLRLHVGGHLEPIFDMKRRDGTKPLAAFVNNPNYTPRQIAYLGKCFTDMARLGGANLLAGLHRLAGASSPEEADMLYMLMRCIHRMHMTGTRLQKFIQLEHLLACVGEDNVLYVVFPGDYLDSFDFSPMEVNQIVENARAHNSAGIEIRALGDVEPGFAERLHRHGLRVVPNSFIQVTDTL